MYHVKAPCMIQPHTVLQDSQLPIVAFTVLSQLCDRQANETEMGAALLTKNWGGKEL